MNVFTHTADLGDVIAALPTIRSLGGGELVIGERKGRDGGRETLRGARFESLVPLLASQPYIDRCYWSDELPKTKLDFSTFRGSYRKGVNLAQQQACHLGAAISETPWLVAPSSPKTHGRPVFARSRRYHNPAFPWDKILQRYHNPLFVGLPDEYLAFQTQWGKPIEYCTAANLLELASLIAGCSVFVGNQSCPFWIAIALGVPIMQETWPTDPNSIIERPNVRYCCNGSFPL